MLTIDISWNSNWHILILIYVKNYIILKNSRRSTHPENRSQDRSRIPLMQTGSIIPRPLIWHQHPSRNPLHSSWAMLDEQKHTIRMQRVPARLVIWLHDRLRPARWWNRYGNGNKDGPNHCRTLKPRGSRCEPRCTNHP